MDDYRKIEEKLLASQEDYRQIPVPEEMKGKLKAGIERAEAEKRVKGNEEKTRNENRKRETEGGRKMHKKKMIRFRIIATAAAAVLLVILPNTGAEVAYAMGSLPVVGKLFQAVTFRDYQYESERFEANVEVPQIIVKDVEKRGEGENEKREAENVEEENRNGDVQQTVEEINFDIEQVTNQLIEEFQESAELGESYGTLEIHHETVTDNENYFTLKLSMYRGAGSGYESYKFYTVDKRTGKQIQIGDLFQEGSNYNEILSEDIKEQMRAQMAEDEGQVYWVDYEEVPEWNWERLKDDQNFYFDAEGNIVIVFDEYEVAPGYMGAREFTVERSVYENILKG
ncbi:MAG: RsiV family protein [Kineothrix sp.]|nr:RsiV family protein [Kineothrix sp.]